jgi:hypothetical protein
VSEHPDIARTLSNDGIVMPIDNQIEPPQSFMSLFVTAGRNHPNAPQAVVLARYELCEDMACLLTEHARTLVFSEDLKEQEVLLRCHQGLIADASAFTAREAQWVVLRLAELLDWTPPDL